MNDRRDPAEVGELLAELRVDAPDVPLHVVADELDRYAVRRYDELADEFAVRQAAIPNPPRRY